MDFTSGINFSSGTSFSSGDRLNSLADTLIEKKKSIVNSAIEKRDAFGWTTQDLTGRKAQAIDGDTFYILPSKQDVANNLVPDINTPLAKVRLDPGSGGQSLDTYETFHERQDLTTPQAIAKLDKQRVSLAEARNKDSWFPWTKTNVSEITNQDIFDQGEKGKQLLQYKLNGLTSLDTRYIKPDTSNKSGRDIADARLTGSDESIIDSLNTPENNSAYNSSYNSLAKLRDSLSGNDPIDHAKDFVTSLGTGATVVAGQGLVGIGDLAQYGVKKGLTALADKGSDWDRSINEAPSITDNLEKLGYDPIGTKQLLDNALHSKEWNSKEAEMQKVIANSNGELDAAKNTLKFLLDNPAHLATGTVAESLPSTLTGMGISKAVAANLIAKEAKNIGLKTLAAGAVTEGLQTAGQIADTADLHGRTQDEYALNALLAGIGTGAINMGMNSLSGDVFTSAATNNLVGEVKGNLATKILKSIGSETTEEGLQTAQETINTNAAEGEDNLFKGIGSETILGAAAGGMTGGTMSGIHESPKAILEAIQARKEAKANEAITPIETTVKQDTSEPKYDFQSKYDSVNSETSPEDRYKVASEILNESANVSTLKEKKDIYDKFDNLTHEHEFEYTPQDINNFQKLDTSITAEHLIQSTDIFVGSELDDSIKAMGTTTDPVTLNKLKGLRTDAVLQSNKENDPYLLAKSGIESKNISAQSVKLLEALTENRYTSDLQRKKGLASLSSQVASDIKSTSTQDQIDTSLKTISKGITDVYAKSNIDIPTQIVVKNALYAINKGNNTSKINITKDSSLDEIKSALQGAYGSIDLSNDIEINPEFDKLTNSEKAKIQNIRVLKSMAEVSKEITLGIDKNNNKSDKWGIIDHANVIDTVIKSGSQKATKAALTKFNTWIDYHNLKATLSQNLIDAVESSDQSKIAIAKKELNTYYEGDSFNNVSNRSIRLLDNISSKASIKAFKKLASEIDNEVLSMKSTFNNLLIQEGEKFGTTSFDLYKTKADTTTSVNPVTNTQSSVMVHSSEEDDIKSALYTLGSSNASIDKAPIRKYLDEIIKDKNKEIVLYNINKSKKDRLKLIRTTGTQSKYESLAASIVKTEFVNPKFAKVKKVNIQQEHKFSFNTEPTQNEQSQNKTEATETSEEVINEPVVLPTPASVPENTEDFSLLFTPKYFPFVTQKQITDLNKIFINNKTENRKELFEKLQQISSTQEGKLEGIQQFEEDALRPFNLITKKLHGNIISKTLKLLFKKETKESKSFSDFFTLGNTVFNKYPDLLNKITNTELFKFINTDSISAIQKYSKEFEKVFNDVIATEVLSKKNIGSVDTAGMVDDDPFITLLTKDGIDPNIIFAGALAALDWMNTATATIANTDEDIKSILGLDDNDSISTEMRDIFNSGSVKNIMEIQLGNKFTSILVVKALKDTSIHIDRKFNKAAGQHLMRTLIKLNLIKESLVPKAVMNKYINKNSDAPKSIADNMVKEGTFFVALATDLTDPKHPKIHAKLKDLFKEANIGKKELDALFNTELGKALPDIKPISKKAFDKYLGDTWQASHAKYTKAERDLLYKYYKIEYTTKTRAMYAALQLGEDFLIQIDLGERFNDVVQQHNKKTRKGKLLQANNNYQYIMDSYEAAGDKFIHFRSKFWKQGRVGMDKGSQNVKMMRWLFAPKDVKYTIDTKDKESLMFFQKAVLASFGAKLNLLKDENIQKEFDKLLTRKELQQVFKDFVTTNGYTQDVTSAQKETLLSAVFAGKEGFHTYAGILELAKYQQIIANNELSFDSHLMREDDGITNGVAFGYLLFNGATAHKPEAVKATKKVMDGFAIFTKNKEDTFASVMSEEGGSDNYIQLKDLANVAKEKASELILNIFHIFNNDPRFKKEVYDFYSLGQETFHDYYFTQGLQEIFGVDSYTFGLYYENILKNTSFTKESKLIPLTKEKLNEAINAIHNLVGELDRSWAKPPLMTNVYGSVISKIAESKGQEVIDKIYNSIQKIIRTPDENTYNKLNQIAKDIKILTGYDIPLPKSVKNELGEETQADYELFHADVLADESNSNLAAYTEESLQKFKLPISIENKISSKVATLYTPILRSAINTNFKSFIDNRSVLNQVFNIGNTVFKTIVEDKIKAKFTLGTGLSKKDLIKIYEETSALMPAMQVPGVDGKPRDLHFWSTETSSSTLPEFKVQTNNKSKTKKVITINYLDTNGIPQVKQETIPGRSDSGHAVGLLLEAIGVKTPIMSIHYIDSLVVKKIMQSDFETLLVHDGLHAAMNKVDQVSQLANKEAYEALDEFNPFKEMHNYISKVLKELSNYTSDPLLKSKLEDELFKILPKIFENTTVVPKIKNPETQKSESALIYDKSNTFEQLNTYNNVFLRDYVSVQSRIKQEIFSSIKAFGNYGGNSTFITKNNTNNTGSTSDIANPTYFDTATNSTVITADNISSVFESLSSEKGDGTSDSTEHLDTMDHSIKNLISKVITPVELFIENNAAFTHGMINEAMNKVALFVNTSTYKNIPMSPKEVFVHELRHAVTVLALEDSSNYHITRQIEQLFKHVERNITPEQINKFAHIFKNKNNKNIAYKAQIGTSTTRTINGGLAEFIAFIDSNEEFTNIIKSIPNLHSGKISEVFDEHHNPKDATLFERLNNIFNKISDFITTLLKGKNAITTAHRLNDLIKALAKVDKSNNFDVPLINDKVNSFVKEGIQDKMVEPLLKYNKKLVTSKVTGIAKVAKIIDDFSNTTAESNNIVARELGRLGGFNEKSFLGNTLKEVMVNSSKELNLLLSKSMKIRDKDLLTQISTDTSVLNNSFTRALTTEDHKGILSGIRADIESLLNSYDMAHIKKFLKDSSKRIAEIKSLEKELLSKEYGKWLVNESKSLGRFMVTNIMDEGAGSHNEYLIAEKALLKNIGLKPKEESSPELLKLITNLSRLYAINFSKESEISSLNSLLDSEESGIKALLNYHKMIKEKELQAIHKGNPTLIMHGKVKMNYNVNREILLANYSEAKRLMNTEGYEKNYHERLKRSNSDVLTHQGVFLHSKVMQLMPWMKATVSYTAMNNSTSNYDSGFSKTKAFKVESAIEKRSLTKDKINAQKKLMIEHRMNNIVNSNTKNDVSEVTLFNSVGKVIGYDYVLSNDKKEAMLEPKFDSIKSLASMNANVLDKVNSKSINEEAIDWAVADKNQRYHIQPNLFVEISANSEDADYRELWARLPKELKAYVKEKFGEESITIRGEMVTSVFGFRKLSIANWIKPIETDEELVDKTTLKSLGNFVYNNMKYLGLDISKIKNGENIWQELMSSARNTIVVKSITTLLGNEASNTWLLKTMGVPVIFLTKYKIRAIAYEQDYTKNMNALLALISKYAIDESNPSKEDTHLMNQLSTAIARNPITVLHDEAIAQTLVEDLSYDSSHSVTKEKFNSLIKGFNSLPKQTQDIIKNISLTDDTKGYKLLNDLSQMSDLTSRFVLYAYRNQQLNNKATTAQRDEILNEVRTEFVQYEAPTDPRLQYGNDMGFFMFSKFYLRILGVVARTIGKYPARVLGLQIWGNIFDSGSTIFQSVFAINKFANPFATLLALITANPLFISLFGSGIFGGDRWTG